MRQRPRNLQSADGDESAGACFVGCPYKCVRVCPVREARGRREFARRTRRLHSSARNEWCPSGSCRPANIDVGGQGREGAGVCNRGAGRACVCRSVRRSRQGPARALGADPFSCSSATRQTGARVWLRATSTAQMGNPIATTLTSPRATGLRRVRARRSVWAALVFWGHFESESAAKSTSLGRAVCGWPARLGNPRPLVKVSMPGTPRAFRTSPLFAGRHTRCPGAYRHSPAARNRNRRRE